MALRVFLDTSVIFSAAFSDSGASRELLRRAALGNVILVINSYVLEETRRNLSKKSPEKLLALETILDVLPLEMSPDPTSTLLIEVKGYVVEKDVMVVAGALSAQVDYLATFDRKHLIEPTEIAERSGLSIVPPEVIVEALKSE